MAITCYTDSTANAWKTARGIIDGKPYTHNPEKSERAGYNIYDFDGGWISDLRTKLEINFNDGATYSVVIDYEAPVVFKGYSEVASGRYSMETLWYCRRYNKAYTTEYITQNRSVFVSDSFVKVSD